LVDQTASSEQQVSKSHKNLERKVMSIKTHESNITLLKESDPGFFIIDDITLYPRAEFEISKFCPEDYRDIIDIAYKKGWIRLVANVNTEWFKKELEWNLLATS